VNDDSLKVTAYFAERQRVSGRFVADAMLDLYGRHQVATSVLLRGITSFGPRHQLRTDESLSLSEDPPVAVAAVDDRAQIEPLIDDALSLMPRGLLTIERARLVTDGVDDFAMPHDLADTAKLTVYVGRQERIANMPAYQAICGLLYQNGLAGASAFLGVDGTVRGERRRARFFSRNVDVPMMIIAIGDSHRVADAVPQLGAVLRRPLLTVERVQLCKRDGELLSHPAELPSTDEQGLPLWQKLMIYTSESARHDGVPIHRGLVHRLFESRAVSGATVLRGIWGFHGDHKPHGDKLIQLGRQVPTTTIIVDRPEHIARCFAIVDELTAEHGLVTSELVPALVSIDGEHRIGGTRLARYRY
jgi:PII-like signaling protein